MAMGSAAGSRGVQMSSSAVEGSGRFASWTALKRGVTAYECRVAAREKKRGRGSPGGDDVSERHLTLRRVSGNIRRVKRH